MGTRKSRAPPAVKFERREQGFAAIERDGAYFMLEQVASLNEASDEDFVDKRIWNTGKLEYPFGRGLNFLIHIEALDELYQSLLENKYPIKLPIEERWYQVENSMVAVKQFIILDPDGFALRFDKCIGHKPLELPTA